MLPLSAKAVADYSGCTSCFPSLPFLPSHWSRHASQREAHFLVPLRLPTLHCQKPRLPAFLFSPSNKQVHVFPYYMGFWSSDIAYISFTDILTSWHYQLNLSTGAMIFFMNNMLFPLLFLAFQPSKYEEKLNKEIKKTSIHKSLKQICPHFCYLSILPSSTSK